MKKDYFGVAFAGSTIFHTLLFATMHLTAFETKQATPPTPQPITLSLYEEPQKAKPQQPRDQPKKQKTIQKQQTAQPVQAKTAATAEPIKTAQTQFTQTKAEPSIPQPKPNSAPHTNQNNDEVVKYLSKIRKILQENLEYPHFAKKAGIEGVATVHFCIKADGSLPGHSLKIIKSSGSSALDKQAIETVQNSAPFTAPPKGEIEVSIPVSFALNS